MSPEDLVKALAKLPKRKDPRLLVGPDTLDDAGVVLLREDLALVQTLDFFPPVVDDPTWFGRIAAANALSDVYAMGGVALSAMSIVGWPKDLAPELLGEILAGGQEKIDEAGALLAGGHTVCDSEIKYGLSVTGTIDPDRILANSNARPGDLLVLTKPIGMGAITTGIKKGKVGDDIALRAMEQMATLNRAGAEVIMGHPVHCATDVTGFGLLGHAMEIALASKVRVEIRAEAIPAFESSLELIERGIVSGGAKRTRSYMDCRLEVDERVDDARVQLALDAETSGGLLFAIAEEQVDAVLRELAPVTPCAVVVGRVIAQSDGAPIALVP
ncbi:MAG: selenide, water dikinase SelD [Planctomycetes bacterium]|nr:selenide, water dikinase SelD [Planctomycetota bacterium]MCB9918490.1 selenide, water dikinase SelD [Planctomycetota bacterium]